MTERDGWEVRSLHKRHAVAMNIWVDKCMPLFFTLDANTAVQELEHNIFASQMSSLKWPHKEEVTTSRHPSPSVTCDLTSLGPHSLSASKPAVVQLQTLCSGLRTSVFFFKGPMSINICSSIFPATDFKFYHRTASQVGNKLWTFTNTVLLLAGVIVFFLFLLSLNESTLCHIEARMNEGTRLQYPTTTSISTIRSSGGCTNSMGQQ